MPVSQPVLQLTKALPNKLNITCLNAADGDPLLALSCALAVIARLELQPLCTEVLRGRQERGTPARRRRKSQKLGPHQRTQSK